MKVFSNKDSINQEIDLVFGDEDHYQSFKGLIKEYSVSCLTLEESMILEEKIKDRVNEASTYLKLASVRFLEGRKSSAISILNKAIRNCDEDALPRLMLCLILRKTQDNYWTVRQYTTQIIDSDELYLSEIKPLASQILMLWCMQMRDRAAVLELYSKLTKFIKKDNTSWFVLLKVFCEKLEFSEFHEKRFEMTNASMMSTLGQECGWLIENWAKEKFEWVGDEIDLCWLQDHEYDLINMELGVGNALSILCSWMYDEEHNDFWAFLSMMYSSPREISYSEKVKGRIDWFNKNIESSLVKRKILLINWWGDAPDSILNDILEYDRLHTPSLIYCGSPLISSRGTKPKNIISIRASKILACIGSHDVTSEEVESIWLMIRNAVLAGGNQHHKRLLLGFCKEGIILEN